MTPRMPQQDTGRQGAFAPPENLHRRLESLEKELEAASPHTGHHRWMIPYADLLTLLLGLFLVLFATSRMEAGPPPAPEPKLQPGQELSLQKTSENVKNPDNVSIDPVEATEPIAMAAQLQEKLQERLDMPGVEIRRQERGLVISLKDSILFAPGSAELSPKARQTLDALADTLVAQIPANPEGDPPPIRVEGHTDDTPITTSQYPSNWELSTARATHIVRYLIDRHHFSPERLSAAGYGEYKPVHDNSSIEGKQKNRRVDIVVLNEMMAQQEPPALAAPQAGKGED